MYETTVRAVPLERILVETDAPYAAPAPHRGERNEPVFVIDTLKYVAKLRGKNEEEMSVQILKNSKEAFKIDLAA
jgi:TatD DNase family protein